MPTKALPRLQEIEIADGPHAGWILRVPPDLVAVTLKDPKLRWTLRTYERLFEETAEGRPAFGLTNTEPADPRFRART